METYTHFEVERKTCFDFNRIIRTCDQCMEKKMYIYLLRYFSQISLVGRIKCHAFYCKMADVFFISPPQGDEL